MEALAAPTQRAVAAHGLGAVLAVTEGIGLAHVVHQERAEHGLLVKCIFPKQSAPVIPDRRQQHWTAIVKQCSTGDETSTPSGAEVSSKSSAPGRSSPQYGRDTLLCCRTVESEFNVKEQEHGSTVQKEHEYGDTGLKDQAHGSTVQKEHGYGDTGLKEQEHDSTVHKEEGVWRLSHEDTGAWRRGHEAAEAWRRPGRDDGSADREDRIEEAGRG